MVSVREPKPDELEGIQRTHGLSIQILCVVSDAELQTASDTTHNI